MKMILYSIRLPEFVVRKARARAKLEDKTVSQVFREAVRKGLE